MSRVTRSRARHAAVVRAVAVAVCGLLLTGCSLLGKDSGTVAAETVTPAPTTPSGPALPAAAKATTNDGAIAFTKHWFATYNHAIANLNSAEIDTVSDKACVFCQRAKQTIETLKSQSRTVSGGETTITNVKLIRGDKNGMRLDCAYDQKASSILDGTGAKVTSAKAKKSGKMLIAVKWTGTQWTMLDVAVLS